MASRTRRRDRGRHHAGSGVAHARSPAAGIPIEIVSDGFGFLIGPRWPGWACRDCLS
jgi:hypothetical protein